MKKKESSFFRHMFVIVIVFVLHELAGMSAWMVWSIQSETTGGIPSSGLTVTGITALILIPVFGYMYHAGTGGAGKRSRKKCRAREWLLLIPFGICVALGLNQLMNLLHFTQLPGSYERTRQILFSGERMASVLILGFLVPLAEELMFRGLVYEHIRQVAGRVSACFFSSVLFGVYHGNPVQGGYAFLIGLLLVYVYERFGSLFAPFLFHSAANIFVYLAADWKVLGEIRGMIISCTIGLAGASLIFVHYLLKK